MKHKVIDKPYDKTFDPSLDEYKEQMVSDLQRNVTGLEPSTQYEFQITGLVMVGGNETPGQYADIQVFTATETGQ